MFIGVKLATNVGLRSTALRYFSAVHLTQQIFTAVTAICIVLFALICMGGGAAPILGDQMIEKFTAERTNPNG